MATLRQEVSKIITNLNLPFDKVLYLRVKDLLLDSRATIIKQSLDKAGLINDVYIQKYIIELTKSDIADYCKVDLDCDILRSKNKIATPIKYKSDTPFIFVGTIDGKESFLYATNIGEVMNSKYMKYLRNSLRYLYIDNYIYLYGNTKIKYARLDAVYANPTIITDDCDGDGICLNDDMEFPITADLLPLVRELVYRELSYNPYRIQQEEEVPIKQEIQNK